MRVRCGAPAPVAVSVTVEYRGRSARVLPGGGASGRPRSWASPVRRQCVSLPMEAQQRRSTPVESVAVQVRALAVPGVVEFTPDVFPDHRGSFVAPFEEAAFVAATGHSLHLAQTNSSVSCRGVVRGVHFADVPPGQGKYVYCARGALLDVAVDVRVGSPAFGTWDTVELDATTGRAVYLPEGVGHAVLALTDDTVLTYLCSAPYAPARERTVHPLDPALGLPWPGDLEPLLSAKDGEAPTLVEARAEGVLPLWNDCQVRYEELRARRPPP